MLSTITVLNTNDSGPDSLRAAITQADMDTTPDTIQFAPSVTGTITLLSALPDLSTNITLSGPGASTLAVARSSDPSTPEFRIFTVDGGDEVIISGLTITGGQAGFGGGIFNAGTLSVSDSTLSGNTAGFRGGGIDNGGTLTVTDSAISGNSAVSRIGGDGGGIDNIGGTLTVTDSTLSGNTAIDDGGIANSGTLTVTDSTLSGNKAEGSGGGIGNGGTLTVTDSTLSGNTAFGGDGGGIFNQGTLTVTDSTLSGNTAQFGGGGIENDLGGTLTVTATIFANSTGGNLSEAPNAAFVSRGHNLFTDAPAVTLDPTDLINTDPKLGPLADNGGPTFTQALLPGSPAIDAGIAVAGVTTDQRGLPRPQGKAPDIGAFELATGPIMLLTPNTATRRVGTTHSVTATVLDPDVRPLEPIPLGHCIGT